MPTRGYKPHAADCSRLRRVWQLLAWLNPVVIPGLRAGTHCVCVCMHCVDLFSVQNCKCVYNKLYFTLCRLYMQVTW